MRVSGGRPALEGCTRKGQGSRRTYTYNGVWRVVSHASGRL